MEAVAMNHGRVTFSIATIVASIAVAQVPSASAPDNRGTNNSLNVFPQVPNDVIKSFGAVTIEATGNGAQNAIVGAVRQTGTGGATFPTGVTGYGSMESAGNQAFGIFGRCDLGMHSKSALSGTCANELDVFNFNGAPSMVLPPNLGFGTTQNNSIALQLVAYGDFDSSIGLNFAGGGGAKQFFVGEYFNPQSSVYSGVLVDATAMSSARYGAILKANSDNIPLHLQTVGTPVPTNVVAEYNDGAGVNEFTLNQGGDLNLGGILSAKSIVLAAGGRIKLAAVVVASLPACTSKSKNVLMAVTDAKTPVYNGLLQGGGNINIPVFCNGVAWTAH